MQVPDFNQAAAESIDLQATARIVAFAIVGLDVYRKRDRLHAQSQIHGLLVSKLKGKDRHVIKPIVEAMTPIVGAQTANKVVRNAYEAANESADEVFRGL